MSKTELLECDICETRMDYIHSEHTTRLQVRSGWSIWWWRGEPRLDQIDVCSSCTYLIVTLRASKRDKDAKAIARIFDYIESMCTADQREFEDFIRKTARKIDRYKDDHPDVYRVIGKEKKKDV